MGLVPQTVDGDVEVALGGSAVGIGGEQVDDVLQAGLELAAFGHGLDEDALLGHREADAHLLGVIGSIGDGHFQDEIGHAALQAPDKVARQIELEGERAIGAGLACEIEDLLALHIVDPAGELHLAAIDRLAKEVDGVNLPGDPLARPVEGLVRRGADLEFGQNVGLDHHRFFGGSVAQRGRDLVVAVVHFAGQLKGPGGNPVGGSRSRFAVDLVALGIGDDQFDGAARRRDLVKGTQGQGADQDLLAGLVDGLVGGEQDLVASLDSDRLLQRIAPQIRPGLDNHLLGRICHVGHGEGRSHLAIRAGVARVQDLGVPTVSRLEGDLDLGTGDGLGIVVPLDLDVDDSGCAGDQAALAQDQGILLTEVLGQPDGIDRAADKGAEGTAQQGGEDDDAPDLVSVGHVLSSLEPWTRRLMVGYG